MPDPKPRLLGISGSLRKASFNTAILHSLAEAVADRATLTVFTLNAVPPYDGDLDNATPPEGVAALRRAIGEADGLVIASPEYNYGMPGVLKNALDWASRPYGKATITGKPVLTLTASPAFTGGARAQAQLNEVLVAVAAQLVLRPQAVVASVHEKIRDGRLVDEATLTFLKAGIDDLLRNIARNASAIRQET
ncbi:NAD(P)H-dependent oxidoreductase [Roseomonas sp. M0104]|uniref:NAD(P)H-dependent oxidoreductase n=1 Tax=Teichococcus coralli TaxID=2545983 RepID=A0A845BCK7_9PROT|nr:NAD(P)H-dependent oxidoreductase [Pseudoroseomonas coralli]MXP63077.1 NAD(P)H-dependent oxidoreductase [Pseudoroseomonas coralli]